METATHVGAQKGLYHSNLVASLDYSERHSALAARVTSCVSRAFHAIGSGSAMQETIYWNLLVTKKIERNEIIDRPAEFIDGIRAIYGEAATVVFEYMLRREIKREFGLTSELDNKGSEERDTTELLRLIAYAASESQGEAGA